MGIPVIKPPPRLPGESLEEYRARPDVQAWRAQTLSVARQQKQAAILVLPVVVAAVIFVVIAIIAVLKETS